MKHLNKSYSTNFDFRKSDKRNNNHKREYSKWKKLYHIKQCGFQK